MQCTRGLRGGCGLSPKWNPPRPRHTPSLGARASLSGADETARSVHTAPGSASNPSRRFTRALRTVAKMPGAVNSGGRSAWHTWGHRHREAPGPGFSLSPRRPRPAQCLGPAGRQTGGETRLVEPVRQQIPQCGIVLHHERHGARDAPSPTGCGSTWGRWTRTTFPWCGQSPWPTRPTGRCGSGRRGLPCRSCTAQWPCP